LRPKPVYIDWQNDCRFTRTIPEDRLSNYRSAGQTAFAKDRSIYAGFPNPKTRRKISAGYGEAALLIGASRP